MLEVLDEKLNSSQNFGNFDKKVNSEQLLSIWHLTQRKRLIICVLKAKPYFTLSVVIKRQRTKLKNRPVTSLVV